MLNPIFSGLLLISLAICPAHLIYSTEWLWRLIKFYYLLNIWHHIVSYTAVFLMFPFTYWDIVFECLIYEQIVL